MVLQLRSFLIIVAMMLGVLCRAQQTLSFNIVHRNEVEGPSVGVSIKAVDGGYVSFSNQRGLTGANLCPFSAAVDSVGTWVGEFEQPLGFNTQLGLPDPVCRSRFAERFYCGFTGRSATGIDSMFFASFDEDGAPGPIVFLLFDSTMIVRKCIQAWNGDLLFTGLHEPPKQQFCLRTDTLGNILDYFVIGNHDGSSIAEDALGNIYMVGQKISDQRASLLKFTAGGSVLWMNYQTDNGTSDGIFRTVKVLADTTVLVVGSFVQYVWPWPSIKYAYAARYSAAGLMLWEDTARSTSNGAVVAELTDAYQRPNGSLVTAGAYSDLQQGAFGLIRSYSLQGDVLWDREFTYYDTAGPSGSHRIWDIEPTSDGGMILTGEAWDNTQQAPQNLWLLKLDSMGCLVPGCASVGVHEFVEDLTKLLRVSPNPASDQVTITLDLPQGGAVEGDVQLILLDASGKVVRQQHMEQNLNQLRAILDVHGLASGTYYVHLRDGKRWLAGSKVVVE
jgi:hypothetical protein